MRRTTLLGLLLVLPFFVLAGAYFSFQVRERLDSSGRVGCTGNAAQISMQLQNYHDRHGAFPPAAFAGETGDTQHSWRVLTLESSSLSSVFTAYDFTQDWNSGTNRNLRDDEACIDRYRCPVHGSNESSFTQYLAVTGEKTAFPPSGVIGQDEILDGPENTILFIEVPDSEVHWSQPSDLTRERAVQLLCGACQDDEHLFARHRIAVGFADGRTERLRQFLSREYAEALTTIAGGENVTRMQLVAEGYF